MCKQFYNSQPGLPHNVECMLVTCSCLILYFVSPKQIRGDVGGYCAIEMSLNKCSKHMANYGGVKLYEANLTAETMQTYVITYKD